MEIAHVQSSKSLTVYRNHHLKRVFFYDIVFFNLNGTLLDKVSQNVSESILRRVIPSSTPTQKLKDVPGQEPLP